MLYLLDANVLIDANRDYYPIARVPEFWEWLLHLGARGAVKIPTEQYEEIQEGTDTLAEWARKPDTKAAMLLIEEADVDIVRKVVAEGYAPDLSDDEQETLGYDPFLVAYALANPGDRCVVTTEVSKPKQKRANRKVPDVCANFGIPSCNTSVQNRFFRYVRNL